MNYYAHTHPDHPAEPDKWQGLEEHLEATAELAYDFVGRLELERWLVCDMI